MMDYAHQLGITPERLDFESFFHPDVLDPYVLDSDVLDKG